MAGQVDSKLIVLWEHEIREAAKRLRIAIDADKKAGKERTEEEIEAVSRAFLDALNACATALYGADDESASLVLTAAAEIVGKKMEQP